MDIIDLKNFLMFLFGGASLKLIEIFVRTRKGDKDREQLYLQSISSAETQFRAELKSEVDALRKKHDALEGDMESLREDVELWKKKYYNVLHLYQREKINNEGLVREIELIKKYVLGDRYSDEINLNIEQVGIANLHDLIENPEDIKDVGDE